jgi:hypothetical protein
MYDSLNFNIHTIKSNLASEQSILLTTFRQSEYAPYNPKPGRFTKIQTFV